MVAQQGSCIFCKIIAQEIPSAVVAQTDRLIVIKDIAPKAPIHYLIIPLKHCTNLIDLDDASLMADIAHMAKKLAQDTAQADFRLVINNGAGVGQSVFHLHAHFLAGRSMQDL